MLSRSTKNAAFFCTPVGRLWQMIPASCGSSTALKRIKSQKAFFDYNLLEKSGIELFFGKS